MQDPSKPVTGYAAANGCPPPHSGTAYPYAAPRPQSQSYQQPYHVPSSQPSVRRTLFAIILSFGVPCVVILVLWLLLRLRLPEFSVDSFSLTNFSVGSNSSSSLTGTWNVRFVVDNPNNRMSISYDDVDSWISYSWLLLSDTQLPPFKQGKRNQTFMSATFSMVNTFVDTWVVNDINEKRARGPVSFNVKVRARVQFKARWWWARIRVLLVRCEDLAVAISSNSSSSSSGNLSGGARGCGVARVSE